MEESDVTTTTASTNSISKEIGSTIVDNSEADINNATAAATTATTTIRVLKEARIKIIPFSVALTKSELRTDWDKEPTDELLLPSSSLEVGVVGTITLLKNSAMIWFGWGRLTTTTTTTSDDHAHQRSSGGSVLGNGLPQMGPMVVAMPRTKYRGAFSDGSEGTCSTMVGGDSCDDVMLTSQMASRLSQKLGMPIFVSGDLSSNLAIILGDDLLSGLDPSLVSQRAAALAEREVARLMKGLIV